MRIFLTLIIVVFFIQIGVSAEIPQLRDIVKPEFRDMFADLESYRQTGTVSMAGMTGNFEIHYVAPNKYGISFDMGIIAMTMGYDGKTAWMHDPNGQVLELSGYELRSILNAVYFANGTFLDDAPENRPVYIGDTVVNDITYSAFKAYLPYEDSISMYVNLQNGLIEMYELYYDEIRMVSHMGDFATIDGFIFPLSSWTESSNPVLNDSTWVAEMEINVDVDPAMFVMYPESVIDYRFPERVSSMRLPFALENGHITFDVTVGEKAKAKFILDSGAGMNAINKPFAEKIGLEMEGELLAKGVTGYGEASITSLDSVTIGGVKLYDQNAAVIDFTRQNFGKGDEFGGLLGFDFISRFPIMLDYQKKQMTIYNPEKFIAPDAEPVPFFLTMKVPVFKVSLMDCEGAFILDLGNPMSVILHQSFIDKCALDSTAFEKENDISLGGIGGQSKAFAAIGHNFQIGPVQIENIPLVVTSGESGLLRSSLVDGNIGNAFLEKFRVVMDYKSNSFYFLPPDSL